MSGVVEEKEQVSQLKFDAKLLEFYKIWLLYIVKCILSLGIYCFWGATKIRAYLTNKFSLHGENFIYSGTPRELFFGFITMLIVIELPMIICYLAMIYIYRNDFGLGVFTETYMQSSLMGWFVFAKFWSLMAGFIFTLMYPCLLLKYRLSRISWKGVQLRLKACSWKYAGLMVLSVLSFFSLNIFAPFTDIKRKSHILNNLYFGNNKFSIEAKSMALMKINIITTILMLPTLFIARFWYYAALDRHIYASLDLNGLKMKSIVTGEKLAKLQLGNFFLLVITLGLGIPLIIQRNIKFYIENHLIIGDLERLDFSVAEKALIDKDYSFFACYGAIGYLEFF